MRKAITLALGFIFFFVMVLEPHHVNAASKKVTLKFANGAVYYGEVKNGKPHGKGSMTWYKDKTYSGDWSYGQRNGYGKYVFIDYSEHNPNGGYDINGNEVRDNIKMTTYNGYWKNDKQFGEGERSYRVSNGHSSNISELLQKGTFKDDKLIKGYEVNSSYDFEEPLIFHYFDQYNDIKMTAFNAGNIDFDELISYEEYKSLYITRIDKKGTKKQTEYSVDPYTGDLQASTSINGKSTLVRYADHEKAKVDMRREIKDQFNPHRKVFISLLKQLKYTTFF